jgi:FlaA1/EpsC-like NDP-sugar epimerase
MIKQLNTSYCCGDVYIPNVPKVKVIDRMKQLYGEDVNYSITGIRRNEKMYDPLYTEAEADWVLDETDEILCINYAEMYQLLKGTVK